MLILILSLQVNTTVCYSYPDYKCQRIRSGSSRQIQLSQNSSKLASRFERAKMSKHSRGDQKTIKVGQVCRDQIENVSCKLWIQMSTKSHLSLQVTIAVIYPLNITTRTTHVVTSSITMVQQWNKIEAYKPPLGNNTTWNSRLHIPPYQSNQLLPRTIENRAPTTYMKGYPQRILTQWTVTIKTQGLTTRHPNRNPEKSHPSHPTKLYFDFGCAHRNSNFEWALESSQQAQHRDCERKEAQKIAPPPIPTVCASNISLIMR